jgi:hypothetical protein
MITLKVYGKDVILTKETLKKTALWFADNCQDCIEEALSGKVRVNELTEYVIQMKQEKDQWLNLDNFNNQSFTFYQRAYFIQSGESVSLLSKNS